MQVTLPLCFLLIFWLLQAQTQTQTQPEPPPDTDIYISEINGSEFSTPRNLTKRKGYDNQPVFFPNHELFYTSIRLDQADTFAINLQTGAERHIIITTESEYSPTLTPDEKYISVVRVEADKIQRLWKFPLKGGPPTLVLENVKPVGYHLWLDENTLLLYILGEPATLHRADIRTGKAQKVADDIGRSLQRVPGSKAASFVRKNEKGEWWIYQIDLEGNIKPIVQARPTEDHDFTWTPSGTILMAEGSKLFGYTPGKASDWQMIADLKIPGITRLAVSPDGKTLAFVAFEP
jgi:Tol biopolymer transport system component